MPVKSIYTKYFQKSKVFLYPLLGIKRGAKVIPSETYLAWGDIKAEDMKLVCLYHPENKLQYKEYEKKVLIKHTRLCQIHKIDNKNKLFIFDLSDLKDNWGLFLDGKYSKMDKYFKSKILNFFPEDSANYVYMKSYLFPNKFFGDYSEILNVDESFLKEIGELCNKPNLEKETLIPQSINLENQEIIN